jgi:hypothetical protein
MMSFLARRAALALAVFALASCGGGSSREHVQTAELPEADQAAVSGDWPLETTTSAFLVKTDAQWQQLWSERQAMLVCEDYAPYNDAACAASGPPAVDFSKYSLVGLLLRPALYFVDPTPTEVFLENDGRVLVVEYEYHTPYKVPFYLYTGTRFFLVPRTEAELSARPKEV